jgi:single-stranded-DNA-specific exonuclease
MAEIKNLDKAAKRILKAIKQKEPIIIYGDSDMDGVCSVIIMKEAIVSAGAQNYTVYFPDREIEGYGINKKSLFSLASPALLVVLDCGIGNVKEVDLANKMGFEVVIIDHHEPLYEYPKASIIVDPKQKGDKYPFKEFAAVGLAFKLSEHLLEMSEPLRKSFLELVAMATIADMMPRTDDNEEMIIEGKGYLKDSWRPGIQALFGLYDFKDMNLMEKVMKVNSLMNIRDIKDGLPVAYRLLCEPDIEKAEKMAEVLLEKGVEKKRMIKEIIREVEERIMMKEENIIFEGDESWDLILLGVVAAVVSKNTKKPVFLYRKYEKNCQGSVRAPDGFNTVEAMKSCSKFLSTYGGHPKASGFKVSNKNVSKFRKCLINYFEEL